MMRNRLVFFSSPKKRYHTNNENKKSSFDLAERCVCFRFEWSVRKKTDLFQFSAGCGREENKCFDGFNDWWYDQVHGFELSVTRSTILLFRFLAILFFGGVVPQLSLRIVGESHLQKTVSLLSFNLFLLYYDILRSKYLCSTKIAIRYRVVTQKQQNVINFTPNNNVLRQPQKENTKQNTKDKNNKKTTTTRERIRQPLKHSTYILIVGATIDL